LTLQWWLLGRWVWEPSILVGLALMTAAYAALVGPLRRHFDWGPAVPLGRQLCFYLGMLVVFVALVSPLDDLADRLLFSAHMAQHMLITYVAPPLWLLGLPKWTIHRIGRAGRAGRMFELLTRPVSAFIVFNATMWLWHVPALYDAALRDESLHIIEHLLFMGTAVIGWWPVLQHWPGGTALNANLGRMVYLILSMLPCTGLAALITFSPRPLYLFYMQSPWHWQVAVSPMLDQQVGGVVMWLPADMILMLPALIFGNRWLAGMTSRSDLEPRPHAA
jgi:cytochrome c oxidase assembly factor CtaG